MMPFFSIVIPTYNRGRYLKFALQSCTGQTFDDYEVVISDNNSTDETREIVKEFDNGKVKYFNTGKNISVTDNFENAVNKSEGEYVLILADDEAYKPTALEKLKRVIDATSAEIISFGRTGYVFPGALEGGGGNYLNIRPFTGNVARVPSSLAMEHMYSLINVINKYLNRALPLSVKCAVHRRVIKEIKDKVGSFQLPPTPDWSSCVMMLAFTPSVVLFDEHLNIAGHVKESMGPALQKTRSLEGAVTAESDHSALSNLTPSKVITHRNVVVNAMLVGQKAVSPLLNEYKLNHPLYFELLYKELLVFHSNGVEVEADFDELCEVARSYGVKLPGAIGRRVDCLSKGIWGKRLNAVKTKLFGHTLPRWPIKVYGKEAGFSDILECSRRFDDIVATMGIEEESEPFFEEAYGSCEKITVEGL